MQRRLLAMNSIRSFCWDNPDNVVKFHGITISRLRSPEELHDLKWRFGSTSWYDTLLKRVYWFSGNGLTIQSFITISSLCWWTGLLYRWSLRFSVRLATISGVQRLFPVFISKLPPLLTFQKLGYPTGNKSLLFPRAYNVSLPQTSNLIFLFTVWPMGFFFLFR